MINVKVNTGCFKILHLSFNILLFLFLISSCSISRQLSSQAEKILLADSSINKGHIGISIYEPATGKYWYNYQADKYFIPASNTKLFTLYTGLKYLGDSLVGLKYYQSPDTLYTLATGDPTFLHPDFPNQPVADFLKSTPIPIIISDEKWKAAKYGSGWAWDDYNDYYMPERNALPVYGNTFKINFNKSPSIRIQTTSGKIQDYTLQISEPDITGVSITYIPNNSLERTNIKRKENENSFEVSFPDKEFSFQKKIPFVTNGITTAVDILQKKYTNLLQQKKSFAINDRSFKNIYSQPSDVFFKLMMQNSDNFFAEQALLMASNERLGYMSDLDMIDTMLKTDFNDLALQPRWVDGSGLSRYNLFTPLSFIYVLSKLQTEFGMARLKTILPTGGEGTLTDYFKTDRSYIFAKTGTLSNNAALSGYIITEKGKELIFSILVNNYPGGATPVRRAVEHFLQDIRKKY